MATLEQFCSNVRRRVQDYEEPRRFDESYYKDAVGFALSKLSFDLDEQYTTPESVPIHREFLITKLATIEMCHARAAQALTGSEEDGGPIKTIIVPDLTVTEMSGSVAEVTENWLRLARDLQSEYDTEIAQIGGQANAALVQVGYLNTFSYRTGGLANRRLDKGLPSSALTAEVVQGSVRLSWSAIYHPEFYSYSIERSQDGFFSRQVIAHYADNHFTEFVDKAPPGEYQYRVYTVNMNGIRTASNTVDVTVP